jgi:hypothetical protein
VWRPNIVVCTFLGMRDLQQAPQGRSDSERIDELRALPSAGRKFDLRSELRVLHVASWLRDIASGVYWDERDTAFGERRLAPAVSELDWPGQRRVPYDQYVKVLEELLNEIREERAMPILLMIPRSPTSPGNAVADVYLNGARIVAGWSNTLVLDGRNAFVRSVSEEEIPSADMFLGESVPSECGHLALAQALADEIIFRKQVRR